MRTLKSFWSWFWHGIDNGGATTVRRVVARKLREHFVSCPACGCDFSGHELCRIAITVKSEGNSRRMDEMMRTVNDEDWEGLIQFDEFDAYEDAIVAQVIRCPDGKCTWIVAVEPYSIDSPYVIQDFGVLDVISSKRLSDLCKKTGWTAL